MWGLGGVTVRIGRRTVLDNVSLQAEPSAITAVVGGDGSGKTTALRTLVGLARPVRGVVYRPDRPDIGYVPATAGIYGDLTVEENLAFAAAVFGVRGREFTLRSEALLKRTDLVRARRRLGGQLSGGMRRKLALAVALLHEPSLLVLDEPSTGVDPLSRVALWRLIASAAAAGAAVVVATANIDEAERASTVLVLDQGRALLSGSPEEVVAATPGILAQSTQRPPSGARSWRRGDGWRVLWSPDEDVPAELVPVEPDLEDAVTVASLLQEERGRVRASR